LNSSVNVINIDPYNFELRRFKVGAVLKHSIYTVYTQYTIELTFEAYICNDVWVIWLSIISNHQQAPYDTKLQCKKTVQQWLQSVSQGLWICFTLLFREKIVAARFSHFAPRLCHIVTV